MPPRINVPPSFFQVVIPANPKIVQGQESAEHWEMFSATEQSCFFICLFFSLAS